MLTVSERIRKYAREKPDTIALLFDDRPTSYAEFDRRVDSVAAAIRDAAVPEGGRVAFLGKNSDSFFEIAVGVARAGACFVPINWRLAPLEIDSVVEDCGALLLFAGGEYLEQARRLIEKGIVRQIVSVDGPSDDLPGYAAWRDAGRIDHAPVQEPPRSADCLQLYTSGTAGRPKGVVTTNQRYAIHLDRFAQFDKPWVQVAGPDDVILIPMPNYHLSGCGTGLDALSFGATIVVQREFSAAAWLDAIAKYRVTRAFLVPAALRLVLDDPRLQTLDVGSLRYITYGASPIQPDVLARSFEMIGCRFVQLYGMTECMGAITALDPDEHRPEGAARMASVGLPLPGMNVRIADVDDAILPIGETGEIQVRCASMMKEYWRQGRETASAFTEDGWLRTGDAGFKDDAGYVYIRDRLRDMIISGGENVYPVEVENAINSHPAVMDAAVIGIPDARWGEMIVAAVVAEPTADLTEETLIAWVRCQIARYKCPRRVLFLDSLPRNAAGKLQRRILRDGFEEWRTSNRLEA